ncbi:glucose-1-phosphate cytidylyltransferase [Paenibacillus hexagrammi]|uniref:Glucose-1-phosphate cytidylyltransferase n=1 Tax=Paenibacillus hexagrammi TaxID=2908839 RepID=A0ABY3SPW6_9BACL|nr:glucose-1-phosphate cytidylyltransferase [Paenibacillus sp. YPD9-1]UJF35503.1 glucose-1-phosphate cytidylyltransferase [Paenibacillus sp. YPD9-1]
MKVVILAGGLGSRIREESHAVPKPMIEIGGKPILWHIMKLYSHFGFHEFIVCLGYKGYVIKDYFANYVRNASDVTLDFNKRSLTIHPTATEPWIVTLAETGETTMTGGRIKRIRSYLGDEPFLLTYGDGLTNVNIQDVVQFHESHGKLATVTAVQPTGRFGSLTIASDQQVQRFNEKPRGDGIWVNGGFFVLQPEVLELIKDDSSVFEKEPLEQLAASGQLHAFQHGGFWYAMDTLHDKHHLQRLWEAGNAPWKLW